MDIIDVKERTARAYIKFMRDHGIIEKSTTNKSEYQLMNIPSQ